MKKLFLPIYFIILFSSKSFSQTIPVGDYAESITRMNQILGISDDLSSFTQHPLNSAFNSKGDSAIQSMVAGQSLVPQFKLLGIPSSIKVLPFTWLNDYNSKLPYGYNNGPLYPNVGYQTMITGGIFIRAGILNIQFKPELVHAENSAFLTFSNVQANYHGTLIPAFFNLINSIDAPERFCPYGLSYAGLGQSKITLIYKNVEAGVSTENMWWGPGVQNSIMMSNSAPGFLHWTFNSSSPIKTIIGSFEWQIIGGRLKQSGFTPFDPGVLTYDQNLYQSKPVVTRYISAVTVNWHPKWVEGLFLGVSAYNYLNIDSNYRNESLAKRLFPVLMPSSLRVNSDINVDGQDFAFALNMRQVFPKDHAEIYFEWARNDGWANLRDLLGELEHSSAYTLGYGRYFKLKENQFIKVATELTHLQLPDTFLLRNVDPWYTHTNNPRDGYTNEGRYIGAGIGPGSNSLMLDISYIKKINSFGIKLERYVHNNDLYYFAFAGTNDFLSHWVDYSSTFYAKIKLKKFLISAEYTPVYMYNYEYLYGNDIKNKHARITLTYYFD